MEQHNGAALVFITTLLTLAASLPCAQAGVWCPPWFLPSYAVFPLSVQFAATPAASVLHHAAFPLPGPAFGKYANPVQAGVLDWKPRPLEVRTAQGPPHAHAHAEQQAAVDVASGCHLTGRQQHHICMLLFMTLLLQGPLAPNTRLRAAVRLFDGIIKGAGAQLRKGRPWYGCLSFWPCVHDKQPHNLCVCAPRLS